MMRGGSLDKPIRPQRGGSPVWCTHESCGKSHYARRLCRLHYIEALRAENLDPTRLHTGGARGGLGHINKQGYRMVYAPLHPNSKNTGYVAEHRLVLSQALGRPLRATEVVHHMNGDRSDNRIENLELWAVDQPRGQRVQDLVEWARSIIQRYDTPEINA